MIKATELRIGNWLMTKKGTRRVAEISDRHIYLYCEGAWQARYLPQMWDELSPIPLTEEWLRRFGFVSNGGNHFWMDICEYQLQYDVIDISCLRLEENAELGILPPDGCTHGHTVYFPCKYVHQLQNLYFALTGEELTPKESV